MKKRIREKTYSDYGISLHRYKDLKEFCLQYDEKKSKINRELSGVSCDGMPKGTGKHDGLENNAIRNAMYETDCQMIEDAALLTSKDVTPDFHKFIIKAVTNDLSYEYIMWLEDAGQIPVGKTDFYAYRRLFYHYLDRLKSGDKSMLLL